MRTYFLYTIQAYEHFDINTGGLRDVVFLKLISDKHDDADNMLAKARSMVSKVGYRISDIVEYPEAGVQEDRHVSHTS